MLKDLRPLIRKPSRLEVAINFAFWFALATGNVARPTVRYIPIDQPAETTQWVIGN